MPSVPAPQPSGTRVLLFSSQALSFSEASFDQLKASVDSSSHVWASQALAQLPKWWSVLADAFPHISVIPGQRLLQDLVDWSRTGSLPPFSTPLPNILLTPLVVLSQIIRYESYLTTVREDQDQHSTLHGYRSQSTEAVGFCTGLLSAFVVASSPDKEHFQRHASRAVCIAMFIGAFVDAHDAHFGQSKSFSVAWSSSESKKKLSTILNAFADAYEPVSYDENRVTVTCSASDSDELLRQIQSAGLTATEINLRGRFHSQDFYQQLDALLSFCASHTEERLPDASALAFTVWSKCEDENPRQGNLEDIAIRAILGEHCDWHATFSAAVTSKLDNPGLVVFSFGPERCVPSTFKAKLGSRLINVSETDVWSVRSEESLADSVAVVGMSVKVAGADDLEEFWDLLCEGHSQHIEVPPERFDFETPWRGVDPERKWYGNFLKDQDAFDHKFFRKSPREMAATDPQQRLILQAAYQAVQQSGYFRQSGNKHIGCYVGVGTVDYERNIGCYAPNAFSATGNLKSFVAGKISHYFGWTGPALTIDTACSASAVAVHTACKAILQGECSAALAGGVTVMSGPEWFQNLAGASFLSTTGSCKPFDASADGYCRGEGVGTVFLKSLAQAIHDGDQILGTIASSAVYQNENSTPITVPNTDSLAGLFSDVTQKARLRPEQLTYIEAHGTGTPVGDPVEYESIRRVFGGAHRHETLSVGSVKGLVGHTECASGIISLIKTLLMIHEGYVPPQASFHTLNPSIKTTLEDCMEITTKLKHWKTDFRAVLINNYGASGSNASMIVTETLQQSQKRRGILSGAQEGMKCPIWLMGSDDRSLRAYSNKLRRFIKARSSNHMLGLSNLSFNIMRQSNHGLPRNLVLTARSIDELHFKLSSFEEIHGDVSSFTAPEQRPVILCFGGQVSTFVGLDRQLYNQVQLLRYYLDECDAIYRARGLSSIYPDIFQRSPIEDTVKLQVILFAIQYACARCWIRSGVQPVALAGHSFGELTALCVSGLLSLDDTIEMIIARAKLVRDSWGPEKGSMIAIEGELSVVRELIEETSVSCDDGHAPVIACFNGPTSFTIAGSKYSIEVLDSIMAKNLKYTSKIRGKRLNVSNAFHSSLVDSILVDLEACGAEFKFGQPTIHLERATEHASSHDQMTSCFIAEHMRKPVFFSHAIRRLAKRYPSSIWLEAGSRSTVTNMAKRALGSIADGSYFQAVDITSENAYDLLAETTASLWKQGLKITFWPHDELQVADYSPLLLPPYQFDKTKHWMELVKAPKANTTASQLPAAEQPSQDLFTFIGYQDEQEHRATFRVNTTNKLFQDYVAGHTIAQAAPLCPSTLQLDVAIEALTSIRPDYARSKFYPQLQGLENHAPMCTDKTRVVLLELECSDPEKNDWDWRMISHIEQNHASTTLHVSGRLLFRSVDDLEWQKEFFKYQRLVGYDRCRNLLERTDVDYAIHGCHIYKIFSEIVDYGELYRGLQRIVGKGNESAGRVRKVRTSRTWLDVPLWDSFCQVAGIYVNCMTDNNPSKTMYISNRIEQWIRSPKLALGSARPETCDVLACNHSISDKQFLGDIFVFDPKTGDLLEVILGVSYTRVSKGSFGKMLLRLTEPNEDVIEEPVAAPASPSLPNSVITPAAGKPLQSKKSSIAKKKISESNTYSKVQKLVIKVSGLEPHELSNNTPFIDIGIDSLMGMELSREIEDVFACKLDTSLIYEVVDMDSLVSCVQSALGPSQDTENYDSSDDSINSPTQSESECDSIDDCLQSTGATSLADLNMITYFAEQLGRGTHEVPKTAQLQHLGVDSLLGSKIWADLTTRFQINLPSDAAFLELTVQDIDSKVNCSSQPTPEESAEPVFISSQLQQPIADPGDPSSSSELQLPADTVLRAFDDSKALTDSFVMQNQFGGYVHEVLPKQTELCIAHTLEAFEKLGYGLQEAAEGELLKRVPHLPKHQKLVDYLYDMLDKAGNLIQWDGTQAVRTATQLPRKPSTAILEELLQQAPEHSDDHRLTFHCGSQLAECLSGRSDGIQLIFGSTEGRRLVSNLYGKSPINQVWLKQMEDFLKRLTSNLPKHHGPLKIIEMGAGTGGTTASLVSLFASLDIPVEYTFSDISGSLVAAARKRFKNYPFLRFRVHDIEKEPPSELQNTQHIVISNNCVHATHNLTNSTKNIRSVLRPDGLLLMVEMTSTLYWVDIIFGLLEGWWMFDDGRNHAVTHQTVWETKLRSAGYGHIDWTDGHLPEASIQRMLVALAAPTRYESTLPRTTWNTQSAADCGVRQTVVDEYVRNLSYGFTKPSRGLQESISGFGVLITGATGSLGCHLVEHFANLSEVRSVICMNRRSTKDGYLRQKKALESRGIALAPPAFSKLKVMETDIAQPMLGLSHEALASLACVVTHIVHSAWPMSVKRPIKGFETQMRAMRNLIDLAHQAAAHRPSAVKLGFQFISSIATVGHYPLHTGEVVVPEERMDVTSVLPSGYGDAKLVCEHLLDATLQKYPETFRPMTVRIGQIAGSTTSGYWNPNEHLPFLLKSSQTLNALPDLKGHLSWYPVNHVAATLGDLLVADQPACPIYHIENPAHQPWNEMLPWLAEALHVPGENVIPFEDWVRQVRDLGDVPTNPAAKVIEFLEEHFRRMSCGGLVLSTEKSQAHSATLANARPVGQETVGKYVTAWRADGLLN